MRIRAGLLLALAAAGCAAPSASAARFVSLDGAAVFDTVAGSLALSEDEPLFPAYTPPEGFTLDRQYIDVVCRAPGAQFSGRVEGAVPESTLTLGLNRSSLSGLGRLDLPECRITRNYDIRDATGPFPQANLELVPLLPTAAAPLGRVPRPWAGRGAGARITVEGSRIVIDARGSASAVWTDEGLGSGAFVAVCDLGTRRVIARFPSGTGRDLRAAGTLRALGRPPAGSGRLCRLANPFTLLIAGRGQTPGPVVRAAMRPA